MNFQISVEVTTRSGDIAEGALPSQSQGKGSNLKGAILDQMMPKSMDFNRFSLILNGFGWI